MMNRLFMYVFLFLFTSLSLHAQTSIGIMTGFTYSKIADTRPSQFNVLQEDKFNQGFVLGPILRTNLNQFFDFKTGLLYTEKGMIRNARHLLCNVSGSAESKFSYLEIPLLLSYAYSIGKLTFDTDLGPSFAYWLGGYQRGQIMVNDNLYDFEQEFDIVDEIKEVDESIVQIKNEDISRSDIALNAGIEVTYKYEPFQIATSFRYVHSTISYVKRIENNDPLMHHRSFYSSLIVTYKF